MIRKIAIFCTIILMVSTTPLSEVLKLPIFIEHYMEYDKGGLIHYVVHHYGGHEKDEDWETDQKLPFMDLSSVLTIVSIAPIIPLTLIPETRDFTFKKPIIKHEENLMDQYLSSIFQPPRLS